MAERIPNTNSATEVRQAFERLFFKTAIITEGATGSVLVSAGIGLDPVWTTSLTALTYLTVDNITINAATITSDTGAISFDNENLTTTGTISGVNVTSGESPGHLHDNRYFTETEHINTSAGAADAGKPIKLNASGLVDATMISAGGIDHGSLGGLSDDDHSQYHNDSRGDARYFTEAEHIDTSAGAADAGKPIKLDAAGHIDATMINDGDVDHGSIGGLSDDDHTQYLLANGTRTLTDNMAVTALKTIDGRDLSVDGSKLDGIEAGADVTDATNVAAAGAAMAGGAFHDGFSDFVAAEHLSLPNSIANVLNDHNLAAHTALGLFDASSDVDHGAVGGLADDDHSQYHNDTRGDARYFQKTEHINTSAGAADAGKPIKLNASGLVDSTMLPAGGATDHGALTGLADDDHTQYFRTDGTRTMTGQINAGTYGMTTTGGVTCATIVTSKTWTSYVSDAYGVNVTSIVDTGWITGWNYGFFSQGYCNGNVGDASMQVMGGIGRGYYQSSGTLGWLIGLKGDCYIYNAAASGTVQKAASFYAQYIAYGGGATATVDATYGIYIEDRAVGTARWAVYHTGTDKSRIGGRFGIGGDPTAMLDITLSEAGTAGRQDCISLNYTNTGTNSYNSIGRGMQGIYLNTTCGIATNYNGLYIIPQTNNAASSNISTLCAIQAYSGFGYHASATIGTAIGLYLRGWGNQAPGTFTEHYGIKIDAISGANTNYAILTTSGHVVFNENGTDSDFRVEGDNDAGLFTCDAGNDRIGIGTTVPTAKLTVNITSIAGTASQQNIIDTYALQTGTNTYNTNGLGIQGVFIDFISHGATNVNGLYVRPRMDNNYTTTTCCGIQTYSVYGEDGAGCTLTTAIGVWIKGAGGNTPVTWTNHYGLRIDRIYGAATLNYAIWCNGGSVVFNDGAYSDSDVRMESELDQNCFFLDASANNIGIGNNTPTVRLDITNASGYSALRLRTAKTPASGTDTGAVGEICWDANYIYVCTATNVWERAAIATW